MRLNRKISHAICLSAFFALPTPTIAENISGNSLHSYCMATEDDAKLACASYIRGAIEGLFWGAGTAMVQQHGKNALTSTILFNALINNTLNICQPDGVTPAQMKDIAIRYLIIHPEERHQGARALIWKSLSEAFPCR